MEELWINKYRVENLKDFIGNSNQIAKIKDWLLNINNFKSKALIISGVHGIGKSLTVNLILKELNYLTKIIYPNEIKDHRILDDFNDYYNHANSIYSKINFDNHIKKDLVLVFEETENISLTSEKKYIMDIFKDNNKLKAFPLIFISNNQHSKLLNDLKKNCDEIRFECPSLEELYVLINKICLLEKIKDYDTKSKNKININTRISYDLDFDKNKQNVLTLIQNNKKIIVCKYLYFGIYHKDTKLWIWSNSIPGVNKKNIKQINDIKKKYYLFENNNNVNIMFINTWNRV